MIPVFEQTSVTRKEAIARGETLYFTGKPCKRGHLAPRQVSTRTCMLCGRFHTKAWREANLEHSRELSKAAYERDAVRQRARSLKWHEENRERALVRMLVRQRAMPEYYRDKHREWAQANKGAVRALAMKRHAAKLKRTPKWADLAAIKRFYEACPAGLQIDHIIPLQGKLVSGLHVLNNLQYLTDKANISKGNRFDPWTFKP